MGELVETILSRINIADTNECRGRGWRRASGGAPLPDDPSRQKAWDLPKEKHVAIRCVEPDCFYRLGHFWKSFRVAIALRVGADVCIPHSCRCGVDSGLHGLSCRYSAGRFPRHSAMNDVVKRALQKAGLPSVLEPPGLDRGDH